ncbi:MAG: cytidylate kinase-like family protein [Eubacteriales bacterium]|nr:cytidylate kinase-like family protein [Eubacteriales bacterium]
MNIITISREFGSGGRELGKRLSDVLGYDYYDNEIITAIASKRNMSESYVENTLDNSAWQAIPLTFGRTFIANITPLASQSTLLGEQKLVIEDIAKAGKDCIIVGRDADVILAQYKPFRIFVCADMAAKVKRCMERSDADEKLTQKSIEQRILRIDKNRISVREMILGSKWGDRAGYDLIINTTSWSIKELAPAVAEFVKCWLDRKKDCASV